MHKVTAAQPSSYPWPQPANDEVTGTTPLPCALAFRQQAGVL